MEREQFPPGFQDAMNFPLIEALLGRRARRFFRGAEIPDGYFAFKSRHEPMSLTELEKMLVLTAMAGNTGWHYLIMRNARYAPYLSNYCGAAGGRTFPSGAGFHTSELFYTDDEGVYFFPTRDAPSLCADSVEEMLEAHRARIHKLADGRLYLSTDIAHVEGHNTWVANRPGSLFVIPVADLAQHMLLAICYYTQNGFFMYDDVNRREIPGLEQFSHLGNAGDPLPFSAIELLCVAECSTEMSCSCYAGALMLQAMGLGGWMYDGINPFSVLGASGDPNVPGLGFRYDMDERWALPNPTGLPGVFEGFCPPHYPDMRAAVEAVVERKFSPSGPYHPDTPGQWKEPAKVRSSAQVHDEEFKACVALQAQYICDTFGKFPGTVPSVFVHMYLQAHHLDLEFYDHFFQPGAYLQTHANHMDRWHTESIRNHS